MTNPSDRLVPTRSLPTNPNLEQLKNQAKDLLEAYRAGDAEARDEVERFECRPVPGAEFKLNDAQRVLARAYGFESWTKLKHHVDGINVAGLAQAVRGNDVSKARVILRQRPELVHMDMAHNNEHRALHYAVLNRMPEMARVLMEAGADPRKGIYPHREATSALTIAQERGYDDIVAVIEADEQRRREDNSCPNATVSPVQDQLNAAIREGNEEAVKTILDEDATLVKACDRNGKSPLHVAAEALDEAMVALLLERGADVKRQDFGGKTPLECAARAVEWRHQGSRERFPEVAQRLRQRGAEMNPVVAVAMGDDDYLRDRFSRDGDRLKSDIGAVSGGLLSIAVQHERIDMLELLLDLGLDVNERTRLGDLEEEQYSSGMPLWHCAASGKYIMAQLLLKRGADPNAQVYASGSPMFQAYGTRDERMKELLKHHGGRPDALTAGLYRDTELGRTMLQGAENPGLERDRFAGQTTAEQMLWGAACGGDPELVRLCLEQVDWTRDDTRWFGILDQPLCIWNHGTGHWRDKGTMDRRTYVPCFELVLARCDPNIVGRFNRTTLHVVAGLSCSGHRSAMTVEEQCDFARTLLDAGARMHVRDELLKSTPLGWACRWGGLELVKLLIERGADVKESDAEPWATPLAWATKMKHDNIAALLREHGATS